MIKIVGSLAAVIALTCNVFAADLKSDLDQMISRHQGRVALFAKNLKTGETIAGADRFCHQAAGDD